jgi:glycosyltransferase involved in cell wall biosynthesis
LEIVLDYRPALRERTGVGEYVHHLAGALVKQLAPGDGVTLFSSSWKDRLGHPIPGAGSLDRRLPVTMLNALWHRLEWPPVEWLGARPDVTWSLHPLMMPTRRAARVVSLMDLHVFERPDLTAAEIRRDYARLAPAHLRRSDAVITISEYTKRRAAERFGLAPGKITVCYPGAPSWPPRPEPAAAGPILHVGTVEPRKNVKALLSAYAELLRRRPDVPPLVFAGRIETGATLLPRETMESLAGGDHVRYLGYVPEEEKLRLYRQASMLVMASTEEGFGIPAVEAMAMGVPVVATNRGSLPEVVGDAAIVADPDDRVGFGQAMERVLDDPLLRAELRARGIRQAARFSWEASAARLLETFREAAARRGAAHHV